MAIISIECLRGKDNKPVIKELAMVYGSKVQISKCFRFAEPYSKSELPFRIQITNQWLAGEFHGIKWEDGYIKYDKISEIVLSRVGKEWLYSKGTENCALLSSILGRYVTNLEDYGCPKVGEIDVQTASCTQEHGGKACALNKCLKYSYWFDINGF
jgi:hypothetical protein